MNILFLLPVVSDARYNNPIGALNKLGTKSTILAFCVLGHRIPKKI